jgi:hypothetical protein
LGFELQSTRVSWRWTDFRNTFNKRKSKQDKWVKIYDAGQAKYILNIIN